jgi:hypothetical protein
MLWEYSEYVYTIQASSRYTQTTGTGWRKGRKGKGLPNTESDSLCLMGTIVNRNISN